MIAPTCEALARLLPDLHARQEAWDHECLRLSMGSPEYRAAKAAMLDVSARYEAIEALILATPAVTLADAAAQLVMATSWVGTVADMDGAEAELAKVERALLSALSVVAAACGVNVSDMAVGTYLRDATPPAPHGVSA